jgi:hypothetical protein
MDFSDFGKKFLGKFMHANIDYYCHNWGKSMRVSLDVWASGRVEALAPQAYAILPPHFAGGS